MRSRSINRRRFLQSAGLGAAALLCTHAGTFGAGPSEQPSAAPSVQVAPGQSGKAAFVPDAEISITAVQKTVQILPGAKTTVYGYEGQLLSGSGATVQAIPGISLGPILRVRTGTKLRILLHNQLPEKTVLHPHGLRVPEDCDGAPMQTIDPGQTKVYEFTVIDRAGPYWFHPHPMGRTAEQVVLGMAGLFYVWDDEEAKAVPGADKGTNDIPMVIQDRVFDGNNQFLYQPNMLWGYLGDRILVNGQPDVSLSLEPRAYRLRILNGSNARTYKLAWSNGTPLQVIGTDGGLLPAPVSKSYVMLMPGERVDVWADLSQMADQKVVLRSLSFEAGGMGMGMMGSGMSGCMGMMGGSMGGTMGGNTGMGTMGGSTMGGSTMGSGMGMMGGGMGMMGGSDVPNGSALDLVTVNVGHTATTHPALGALPALSVHYGSTNVPDYDSPRPVTLAMQHMMTWTLNGRVYEPAEVAEDEKMYLDQIVAWEFINLSPIPHPMHIHNVQFQVVERNIGSVASSYSTVNQGLLDTGWKDTVLVWPGERVKVAMKFGPDLGMYMYHCHILEHEDMTMMRNFMIVDKGGPGM